MSGEFEGYMSLVQKYHDTPGIETVMKAQKDEILATVDISTLTSAVYELEERVQQLEIKNQALGTLTHVMLHTMNATVGLAQQAHDKADALEPWLSPVFWICPSPHCGAPQEVPGIVWWLMRHKIVPCVCQVCTWYALFEEIAHYGSIESS